MPAAAPSTIHPDIAEEIFKTLELGNIFLKFAELCYFKGLQLHPPQSTQISPRKFLKPWKKLELGKFQMNIAELSVEIFSSELGNFQMNIAELHRFAYDIAELNVEIFKSELGNIICKPMELGNIHLKFAEPTTENSKREFRNIKNFTSPMKFLNPWKKLELGNFQLKFAELCGFRGLQPGPSATIEIRRTLRI